MNDIKVYQKLTYIECYDWNVIITPVSKEQVDHLRETSERFVKLWNQSVAVWNIKTVTEKELNPVEQVIYSIDDKILRDKIKSDVEKRIKDWLRVNVEIVQNLLAKYQ